MGCGIAGQLKEGEYLLGSFEETSLAKLVTADLYDLSGTHFGVLCKPSVLGYNEATGKVGQEVPHNFGAFGHEEALLSTFFLLF
jgi:hypothetical protein